MPRLPPKVHAYANMFRYIYIRFDENVHPVAVWISTLPDLRDIEAVARKSIGGWGVSHFEFALNLVTFFISYRLL